jgi:hypothetical protein
MNAIGDYWQTVGRKIEEDWRGKSAEALTLAEVATRVLTDFPAPPMNATSILDWMIEAKALPRQVNFHSGFGEPPLVVYETPEFFLEVLFWFPSPTGIHGHAFTGAFMVLDGFSIQVEFDFHEKSAPEEGVRLGRLEARTIEFIGPGKVCPILPNADFIHAVTHLGNPSLTLVARTFSKAKDRQFRFHRCGFALWSSLPRESAVRHAEVLAAVRAGNSAGFLPRLERLLERLGDADFYGVLETLLKLMGPSAFAEEILPLVGTRFAVRHDVVAAIQERARTRALWASIRAFPNPRAQVQCALADLFPDPRERDAILCKSYGVEHAAKLPERWRDLVANPETSSLSA